MLTNAPIAPTIPVTDLNRAKDFYINTLGLQVEKDDVMGGVILKAGDNTQVFLYQRGPSKADHTLAAFKVEDIEQTMDELSQKGVVFEQYDIPEMNLKTNEKGIADMGADGKGSWFKDPDGNILSLAENP